MAPLTDTERYEELMTSLSERLDEHERKQFEIWDKAVDFQQTVGQSIITLNHEMGGVQGRMDIMLWFMGGTTLATVAGAVKLLFFS